MRGFIGVTDQDWYNFLLQRPDLDEVNFWRPSGKGSKLEPGTPFLFKLSHRAPATDGCIDARQALSCDAHLLGS